MDYALIEAGRVTNVIVADAEFVAGMPGTWVPAAGAGIGWTYDGQSFAPPAVTPAPVPANPAEWLIDIGPFFDRFGAAKLAVLAHTDPTVRALVTDLQVRKWIDLKRADVGLGLDLLISKSIPGVTPALKTAILTTPPAPEENLALRKTYFAP